MNIQAVACSILARQHSLISAQPPDANHDRLTREVIAKWADTIAGRSVLDVGCGQGLACKIWEAHGYKWTGVALGGDCYALSGKEYEHLCTDMHMLSGAKADVVYARHALEHSPFPAIALESWTRVASWLIVVVPVPGRLSNMHSGHLSVLPLGVWRKMFRFLS